MEKFNQHSALAEPENPDSDGIKMDGCDGANRQQSVEGFTANLKYLLVGVIFGIVFVKAEIVSWFRIQEMFRLDSFHMYGVIGSAVVVGLLSVWLIKKFNIKTLSGEPVSIPDKAFDKGQIYGGAAVWRRLGHYRCLPGTVVRTNRCGVPGSGCYPVERHCRNLGLRTFPVQAPALITVCGPQGKVARRRA
jgi:hypothetical protein